MCSNALDACSSNSDCNASFDCLLISLELGVSTCDVACLDICQQTMTSQGQVLFLSAAYCVASLCPQAQALPNAFNCSCAAGYEGTTCDVQLSTSTQAASTSTVSSTMTLLSSTSTTLTTSTLLRSCDVSNGNCGENAVCTQGVSGVSCECTAGYESVDGTNCMAYTPVACTNMKTTNGSNVGSACMCSSNCISCNNGQYKSLCSICTNAKYLYQSYCYDDCSMFAGTSPSGSSFIGRKCLLSTTSSSTSTVTSSLNTL